ncbi:hypothetical protein CV102_19405 [Natronococcus pandeyae]|uniref:Uncharacterized protein n=1 Tax=Natronococcus pandeyae TaxID=2055836 RepID=A0A8J8PY05_9EURY|nr:hypothetical protein [Natronococcus pandeyae]TYL36926.1 hypothetical protein CV102_19405 [Natronococcus pandeyae]
MAPALVHFLVGAALLLLLATPLALRYRLPAWVPLWLVAVGGLWGLFPDIHHIAPIYGAELHAFHDTQWANLFAFHYTLDRPAVRTQHNASVVGAILFFFAATGTFTLAAAVHARTTIAETTAPHLVAVATAVVPALLVVAAMNGGLL